MDNRSDDCTDNLIQQPPLPCQALDPDLWFNDKPSMNLQEVAFVENLCLDCPLAQQVRCATLALKEGHVDGTWAGVTLPGAHARKRKQLKEARGRLRLIAGIEQCSRATCGRWHRVVEHTVQTLAQARKAEPAMPHRGVLCPRCVADDKERLAAEGFVVAAAEVKPQIPSGATDDESDLALYWKLRHYRRPAPRIIRSEWLLIAPDGAIEGCYAWHTAARSFGRTDKRFLALLADGWTVRMAVTRDDRNWRAA
jgi:hypothetical protein